MSVEVTMPKLSDTMEEGTIIRWGVKVGDRVSRGDVIAEVETDKAAMEMEAFEEGFVSDIRVGEGETVPVGTVIAVLIGGPSEGITEEKSEKEKEGKEPEPSEVGASGGAAEVIAEKGREAPSVGPPEKKQRSPQEKPSKNGQEKRIPASPAARKMAEEKGISLSELKGSGPGGRIVLEDVERKIVPGKRAEVVAAEESKELKASESGVTTRAQRIRKVVARKMEESWKNIPHFYITMVVDVGDALRFHGDLLVSLNDFLLAAVGRALRDHPRVNSLWQEGEAIPRDEVNVAFAVATEHGLYSPVLKQCDRLSLKEIHQRSRELQERIKAGTISGEDLDGATFTVSNMGMLGVESFSAIITPPQAAALAAGEAVREAVVAENGELEVVQRLHLTLSADHRVMDGADGAAFLRSVKKYLEAPLQLIVTFE